MDVFIYFYIFVLLFPFPLSDHQVSGRALLYVCLVYFLFWYSINHLYRKKTVHCVGMIGQHCCCSPLFYILFFSELFYFNKSIGYIYERFNQEMRVMKSMACNLNRESTI